VQRLIEGFETLTAAEVPHLGRLYAPEVAFQDPFHAVQGLPAVQAIYARMFQTLWQPRFVVSHCIAQGEQCVLVWDFFFATRGRNGQPGVPQRIHGCSLLALDAQGRILRHRDYWDAAEEFYEKLPLLGVLMRWLKRRVAGH